MEKELDEAAPATAQSRNDCSQHADRSLSFPEEEHLITIFANALNLTVQQTGSAYGFLGILNGTTTTFNAGLSLIRTALDPIGRPIQWHRSLSTIAGLNAEALLTETIKAGKYELYHWPMVHKIAQHFPREAPNLESVALIPLMHASKLMGLIGLCNRKGGFTPESIAAILPEIRNYEQSFRSTLDYIKPNVSPTSQARLLSSTWPGLPNDTSIRLPRLNDELNRLKKASTDAILTVGANKTIESANESALTLLQAKQEQLIGQKIENYISRRLISKYESLWNQNRLAGKHDHFAPVQETKITRSDGETFTVNVAAYHLDSSQQTTFILHDLTELYSVRRRLAEDNQRFRAVANLAPIGILQTTAKWECRYVNHRWCEMSGLNSEDARRMSWIKSIHPQDLQAVMVNLRDRLNEGREFYGKFRFLTPWGRITWIHMNARPLYRPNGSQDGFIATFADVTQQHEVQEQLRQFAQTDSLTGLSNRSLFLEALELAILKTSPKKFVSLLFLDLDGFKRVNDALGHDAGDQLLQAVAARLQKCTRSTDLVARMGGDEFTVLMEQVSDQDEPILCCKTILKELSIPFELQGSEFFITTSVGIVYALNRKLSAKKLLKRADLAMYQAKAKGRNNFQFYSPGLDYKHKKRSELSHALHRALEREQFTVVYQAQAQVQNNALCGFEALLRWQHPEKGTISPKNFIPLLEETGLIVDAGLWIFKQACVQYHQWLTEKIMPNNSHISINISPRQIKDESIAKMLWETAVHTGISTENIVLEITESVFFDDEKHTQQTFKLFKDYGFKIALDDFGTGYSSLSYLKKFPVDFIKIDRSFIQNLISNPDDIAITKAIIALSHSLELEVIAEGVDSQKILDKLKQLHCQNYQGYHLARPLAANAVFPQK